MTCVPRRLHAGARALLASFAAMLPLEHTAFQPPMSLQERDPVTCVPRRLHAGVRMLGASYAAMLADAGQAGVCHSLVGVQL